MGKSQMDRMRRLMVVTASAAVICTSVAVAAPVDSGKPVTFGPLRIDAYAMRATLGNLNTTAVYVSVTNMGHQADTLTAASCDCAKMAMLHRTTHTQGTNGMAGMTGMDEAESGFAIAPGAMLQLKPGGDHIMLMGVKHRLLPGSTETVKLTFAHAGVVTLNMPVTETPLGSGAM